MNKKQEQTIRTIEEYLTIIKSVKLKSENEGNKAELLFRGQKEDKPLVPALGRLTLKGKLDNIEKLMLSEFERGIIPLSEFKPENNWDLLALAQHHGLPTRLLDWTYNALIALWFVVRDAPTKEQYNGVVWILNATVEDFRVDEKNSSPLTNTITKIYRPRVISRRISAQSGVFTVHNIKDNKEFQSLDDDSHYEPMLTKVVIPKEEFRELRKHLKILGINNSSVFPDLDGFCKHLSDRFSKLSDEK